MDIFEAIYQRRSIRQFKNKKIPKEMILKILKAAIWAPSAGNLQSWYFVVVENRKVKVQLAQTALEQDFIVQAPIVIVVCADQEQSSQKYGVRGKNLYCVLDAALATENILLSATALGLATCFVGAFDEGHVRTILNLKDNLSPIAIIPIGYATANPLPPERKNLDEVSKWLKF